MRNYLVLGEWNVVCYRCGLKKKSSMLKKEWTGLMVCKECWEPKHEQLMIKVPQEKIAPPWKAPEPSDAFVSTLQYLYIETSTDDPGGWLTMETGGPGLTTEN